MISTIRYTFKLALLAFTCSCAANKPAPETHQRTCLDKLLEMKAFHVQVNYHWEYPNLIPFPCAGTFNYRYSDGDVGKAVSAYIRKHYDQSEILKFYAKIKISGYNDGEPRQELIITNIEIVENLGR